MTWLLWLAVVFCSACGIGMLMMLSRNKELEDMRLQLEKDRALAEQSYFGLSHWFAALIIQEGGKLTIKDNGHMNVPAYFIIHCQRQGEDLHLTTVTLQKIDVTSSYRRDHYRYPMPRLCREDRT